MISSDVILGTTGDMAVAEHNLSSSCDLQYYEMFIRLRKEFEGVWGGEIY